MPKVFISRRISQEAIDLLRPHAEVTAWQKEEAPSRQELFQHIADKEGLIVWLDKVDAEFLNHAPKVKVIAHRAAGFDNIDVEEATRRGIMVCNAPRGVIEATADFAFGLMLASARKMVEAINATSRGEWKIWDPMAVPYLGDDVHHKTLGIIGMGRIGSEVARRARGFSMKVIYYDIVRNPHEAELGAEYIPDLATLLREADFVTIHVPLNKETRHIIGAKELACMKPTAILINTSRGGTVDQKALYQALKERRIQAAAIDVTEEEPIAPDDPLLSLDNIIISPHIAGGSKRARLEMDLLAAENVVAALKGDPIPSCVNCHLLK
ncbi:MAG TPA: D-glycerate dehydrogenase [Dehalococcoidia bacterium]|jgi:glyoxylate reductase|nr:D-glycerate dehydrogenase [Dehalococcoidia bacterium]